MKTVVCSGPRPEKIDSVIENGAFRYRLDFGWAKWPNQLQGVHTLNACFDAEGRMYVATDNKAHPIVIFDSNGNYLGSIGEGLFEKAHSAFLTAKNTLLVADTSPKCHVIREITLEGRLVRDFGVMGQPGDSGYDMDYLKVLQAENRVPKDPAWNKRAEANARLDSIQKRGTPFCRPCAMVTNEKGEYFAADGYGNVAVHKFNADGSYAFSWGEPGQAVGAFRLVHDIKLDRLGRVWVADRENSRVQVFTQEGEPLAVIGGNLMRIGGIWLDEAFGYIGELDGGVTIVDLDLNVVAQLGCKGSVIHAHGLTGDRHGNLYVLTNKKNENNILRLVKE